MQAVILAAGDGDRMGVLSASVPKPLLRVGGRPIIGHVLDAMSVAGIDDIVVVLGHRAELMRGAVEELTCCGALSDMRLQFVENAEFELGNARSIWQARNAVSGPFVLAMADHLVEPAIYARVVEHQNGDACLAIDRAGPDDSRADEATRALVEGAKVRDLGKELSVWNALDTGVFRCGPEVFDAMTPELRDGEAGAVFATMARDGRLGAVDVTGSRWIDIDTAEDLACAEAALARMAWRGNDGRAR